MSYAEHPVKRPWRNVGLVLGSTPNDIVRQHQSHKLITVKLVDDSNGKIFKARLEDPCVWYLHLFYVRRRQPYLSSTMEYSNVSLLVAGSSQKQASLVILNWSRGEHMATQAMKVIESWNHQLEIDTRARARKGRPE